ncbi:oligosaccharide flippase family protein [Cupriavidus malaysiensis]|uniref:Polysaccharide biosynthesis protein n=1 Tax=Cupriavidus malaysiensis TaxID=367825 RepID=A0ABN2VMN9_9BURK|nr:oligosaccharide flippase family protein [Cupriavidus malaysiensis]AOZ05345.1 polysaccharide biosynthesis protein [Cupriavidus malaysiensis]
MRVSSVSWNLAGLTLPLLVAAVTVPQLIHRLGNERFGVLALAWGLVGYAGALDLGIGRALTQMVARLRGEGDFSSIPDALATAGRITLLTGAFGGVIIAIFAIAGGGSLIHARQTATGEIELSILLLALALPAQAMSATYRGVNEAYLNFRGISVVRALLGMVNFGGPYLVSLWTSSLPWLVATLVLSRLFSLLIYRRLAMTCISGQRAVGRTGEYSSRIARSLFSFGGWVTVSSIVSPMLVQADRFVISSAISAAAVTIYVLPYEMVVQSLVLVGSVSSVLFPSLSAMMRSHPTQWQRYFLRWLLIVAGMMLVVCIAMFFFLPKILTLWVGQGLHPESITVGKILCLGVFSNSLGVMFYALLHAKGRANITALLHMIELPIFVGALLFLLHQFGVVGAAWAWTGRMTFDAIALGILGGKK